MVGNGILAPTLERIYEAASDLERYSQISETPNRKIDWLVKIKICAETVMAQSQSLDTNTDGEILLIAIQHKFDPLQTCAPEFVPIGILATAQRPPGQDGLRSRKK